MSLMQLLAVGKSIGTIQDRPSPYRMRQQALLPKFRGHDMPEPDSAGAGHHSRRFTFGFVTTLGAGRFGGGTVAGSQVRRWHFWKRVRGEGARVTGGPVQPELALDLVKVVRNDLSDADLEVIASRAAGRVEDEERGWRRWWSQIWRRVRVIEG